MNLDEKQTNELYCSVNTLAVTAGTANAWPATNREPQDNKSHLPKSSGEGPAE